jgi:hypothetical protein
MGDSDEDNGWEEDIDLDALDAKLGGATANVEEEEDQVDIPVAAVAAAPSAATQAAKLKAIEAEAARLNSSVTLAQQEKEGVEDKKTRERKAVEDADHALTEDLLGAPKASKSLGSKSSASLGLAAIPLGTKAEHTTFGLTIAKKLESSTPLNVGAFIKSLFENLPPAMTTESMETIAEQVGKILAQKKAVRGEVAKVKVVKSAKQIKQEAARHKDVFGGAEVNDEYDEKYASKFDDFM